jgi:hypothetical protein
MEPAMGQMKVRAEQTDSDLLEELAHDFDYMQRCVGRALADLKHLEGIALVDKVRVDLESAYDAVDRAGHLQRALQR